MPRRPTFSPEEVEVLHVALQTVFRQAGHGSITRVERALGVTKGFFRKQRRAQRLDVGSLLSTLKELGVDPVDFFAFAFGREDGNPSGYSGVAGVNSGLSTGEAKGVKKPSTSLAQQQEIVEWLDKMDELRYDDPEGTLTQLRDRARDDGIPDELVSHYLCVAASVHRALGSLTDANLCLDGAERRLWPGDESRRANILQRRAFVIAEDGDLALACSLASQAVQSFSNCGDLAGLGKALVDHAEWLVHLERFGHAEMVLAKASGLLAPTDTWYQYSLYQHLAFICYKKGQLKRAIENVEKAKPFVARSQRLLGHTLWLESRLRISLKQPHQAADLLEQVANLLHSASPIDALLASVEAVRLLIQLGEFSRALETRDATRCLLPRLKGNTVAEAAVTEVYRSCAQGRLDAETFSEILKELRKVQARPRMTLGARLTSACAYLEIPEGSIAAEIGVPEAALRRDEQQMVPTFKRRVEIWLQRWLPEYTA